LEQLRGLCIGRVFVLRCGENGFETGLEAFLGSWLPYLGGYVVLGKGYLGIWVWSIWRLLIRF